MAVRPAARRRVLLILAVVALVAWGAATLLGDRLPGSDGGPRPSPLVPAAGADDPFAYSADEREAFERRAAAGLSHVLYAKSPGGAVASAARVARYRALIEDAAREAGLDADTIEGIVLLESAGRPDAQASNDPAGAVGLTQILAETGQNLLDMQIDTARSKRLTRQIGRAERRGQAARVERLKAQRRRVDERYDPPKALKATARYLTFAKGELGGRDDLAVASYHMGVGNLQNVLRDFGADPDDGDTPYAEVFFDSSPLRHKKAWSRLASLGDDSSTYLWRVLAAKDIMRRYREDPRALGQRAVLMTRKNSAEEVLQPEADTAVFEEPSAIEAAVDAGQLTPLQTRELRAAGVRIDRGMGELAPRLEQPKSRYRALRPEALALLVYLARGTEEISGDTPLILTSTVRDEEYQRLLTARNVEATHGYSLHTTGWAMDIERTYASRKQALAFQFMLDRLQALNLIAWVREPAAIHLTAGPDARRLLGFLQAQKPSG
ncbi:MAG TPA: transglycosylase SLT domain-containing protein [Solirubrobacteraceae bacterium]|nr:transglycosylase SLT domain-containing protein [Solirubrobacteraceae bacterium]